MPTQPKTTFYCCFHIPATKIPETSKGRKSYLGSWILGISVHQGGHGKVTLFIVAGAGDGAGYAVMDHKAESSGNQGQSYNLKGLPFPSDLLRARTTS